MDKNTKYALIAGVLIGGYLLYRQMGGTDSTGPAGLTMSPEVANSPLLPEVQSWIAQTGTSAGSWSVALSKFTLDELGKLHTLIYEIFNKNIDPYKYFFDAAHTETAGNWFAAVKQKYSIS